ncbi:LuxR C-terminal-related transcriptional regulator [Nocardioides daeguensis]|uniref:LuxR C-terminal-related transcriptional regulator n=1 Tax=Nocardioides daeguensis TaxID=908359 RepID=A0ABP6VWJ2_9ACTN|nr:LuxR family transcriptional regulator [Nocardioides daeguensis]MBV6729751.1 LuxR C-terminal-related transcriptional regulator [Nocardioides daeguensis]MCR1772436.1 LuxR C-terminal-related transcriptional regulator [Nocardioides daeguensis]
MRTVGREEELERLRDALARPECQVVLIAGEGGVGKTHLLDVLAHDSGAVRAYGTAAMAGVPLSAMAHLVAPTSAALTAMVADVVRAVPDGGVLAVDDLDQCDDVSLGVALRVARDHGRTLVATVRTRDGELPPAIGSFAHDRATELVTLAAFSREDTERFVQDLLGDVVDAGIVQEVWTRTGGNALFIAQVIGEARHAGTLHHAPAGWVSHGRLSVPVRLRQALLARLAGCSAEAHEAARLVAAVGRMSLDEVERSRPSLALDELIDNGILLWDGPVLRFVHPLFAEVLWAETSPLLRRRLLRRHLDLARDSASPDVVRIAVLGLDAGEPPDPAGLLAAARLANAGGSAENARRLAAAAVEHGDGDVAGQAALVLAAALSELGRSAEAVETLRSTLERVEPGPLAIALAVTVHKLIVWGTFDLAAAAAALQAEARRYPEGAPMVRESFAIAEADSRIYAAEVHRAEMILDGIDLAVLPTVLRMLHATTRAHVLTHLGRTGEALDLVGSILRLALDHPQEVIPGTRDRLLTIASHAAREHGSYALAVEYGERCHDGALADGIVVGRAWGAVVASAAWGQVGDLDTAALWGRRALVAATACGMVDVERLAIAMLMMCAGSRGQAVPPELLDRLAALPAGVGFLRHQMPIAHAWAAYGAGRPGRARSLLRAGEQASREVDARLAEAWILHERVRMGDREGVAARLAALELDSPIATARLRLVTALDGRDGTAVVTVAEELADLGAVLAAAEAAAEGARLLSGRPAAAARRRAHELAARIGHPSTPLLVGLPADPLSHRERTVAELAADGASNAEIAERLHLSVRTVENHLSRVYAKLGVASRAGLAAGIGGPHRG